MYVDGERYIYGGVVRLSWVSLLGLVLTVVFGSFLFSCWLDLEFGLSGLLCSGLVWSMYFHGFCSWLGFNFIIHCSCCV